MTLDSTMPRAVQRPALRGAAAGLLLPAGLAVTLAVLLTAQQLIHIPIEEAPGAATFFITVIVVQTCAGAVWAGALAHLTGARLAVKGRLGVGLAHAALTILAVAGLGAAEGAFVERGLSPLPIHNTFTMLFVIAAAGVGALLGLVLGLASRSPAARLALDCGLASGAAFLLLNIAQDVLGRRVGGPDAGQTATMLTVTLVCYAGAAMAGSAAAARRLARP